MAAALRLPSLVSTLLAAYVAFVAGVGAVTWVLSPFHAVTPGGLAAAEAVVALGALAVWTLRGRPTVSREPARAALRAMAADPVTLAMIVLVACVLAYELVLAATVPADNWDSLTYHLTRAAFWTQHHGVEWIQNAPTDRQNEFQPLAEQQILFLFAATGSSTPYAVPQYLAELAVLVAVYGIARRLGFGIRAAVGSAFLLSTFGLVSLEATTAQNDLFAASLVAAAACLLLGTTRREAALAGIALGAGLGAKLTTLLVWPVLLLLVWQRGRRAAVTAAAGAAAGFVAAGMGGFVLNLEHTGHLLGRGGGRTENTASPSFPGSVQTGLHVLYRLFDLSSVSDALIAGLAVAGCVAAVALVAWGRRTGRPPRQIVARALLVALPFLSPLVVIGVAHTIAFLARVAGIPVADNSLFGHTNRVASEDYAAFGPLGAVLIVGGALAVPLAYALHRVDVRQLALALALPCFLVLLALESKYNPFLTRFTVVAAVLTAPLSAWLFRSAAVAAALATTGAVVAFVTLGDDVQKPWRAHPWTRGQAGALRLTWQPQVGNAIVAYRRLVPPHACVGAIVGGDEPAYELWGPSFDHRVAFLPPTNALADAYRDNLFYVVVSPATDAASVGQFETAGWRIRKLGTYWLLAVAPHAASGQCV